MYIINARENKQKQAKLILSYLLQYLQSFWEMSIGITEKQILYDNPCAPIVQFSHSNNTDEFDEEDMTDDQTSLTISNDILLNPTIG